VTVTIEREVRDDARSKPDAETWSRIERTGLAVVDRVRADLVETPFDVVIADALARLIGHPEEDAAVASDLEGQLSLVVRANAPAMETVGCLTFAAEPISDPRSGRPVGAVAILCRVEAASELMRSYVRRIRREIEDGLLEDASPAERALTAHFLRARRHARGAVVCLNERTMITNAAAAGLVDESDRSMLWDWARRAIACGKTEAVQLRLSRGISATARCERVDVAGDAVGALIRLDAQSQASSGERAARGKKRVRRQTFGWASLTAAQLGVAELVSGGLTNGQIAARLYLSPHTIDFHLREIFAKLTIESRVELARIVSEHAADERAAQP
jgi:DNA-binding CsgD family transcriptional regulator